MSSITTNLSVIAAICGNFWQESQVNPGAWEGWTVGNPGFGLGQWTDNPPQVMRRTALYNWLDSNGYSRDSGEGQLKFLVYENVWIPSLIQPSYYATLTDFFNTNSVDIQDLTREFMWHWEGINDGTLQVRYNAALDFYDFMVNSTDERHSWTSVNSQITYEQAKWNCLNIMDFFLGTEHEITDEEILAIVSIALKRRKKGGGIIVF